MRKQVPELTARSDLYGEGTANVDLDEEKLKEVHTVQRRLLLLLLLFVQLLFAPQAPLLLDACDEGRGNRCRHVCTKSKVKFTSTGMSKEELVPSQGGIHLHRDDEIGAFRMVS